MNWQFLKTVLAVSRNKSLAAAGRKLNVNETTIARHIAQFEQQLGAQLFERTGSSLHPTTAGQKVITTAEQIELQTQTLENAVSGTDQKVAGKVRLTTVPVILNHLLIPALPKLTYQHPQLCLELIADSRDLSLINRQADIALRLARPTQELRALTQKIG